MQNNLKQQDLKSKNNFMDSLQTEKGNLMIQRSLIIFVELVTINTPDVKIKVKKLTSKMGIHGVWMHTAVYYQNKIIVLGGWTNGWQKLQQIFIYDINDQQWERHKLINETQDDQQDLPKPMSGHTATLIPNGKIVVFGGDTQMQQIQSKIYILNINDFSWEMVENATYQRYSHTANLIGENIYLFGGCKMVGSEWEQIKTFFNDLHIFNNNFLTCKEIKTEGPLADIPKPRASHNSVVVGNNLYVYGGVLNNNFDSDPDIYSLNIKTLEWSRILVNGQKPEERCLSSFFLYGPNQLYLFGGANWQKKISYNDIYVFNIKTNTWKRLMANNNPQLVKRYAQTTTIVAKNRISSTVYIIGGAKKLGQELDDMIKFEFEGSKLWWMLHYFESTGIRSLIGRNQCQDLIEIILDEYE